MCTYIFVCIFMLAIAGQNARPTKSFLKFHLQSFPLCPWQNGREMRLSKSIQHNYVITDNC